MNEQDYLKSLKEMCDRFRISELYGVEGLTHPERLMIFDQANKLATAISQTIDRPTRLGGSSVLVSGRSFLLNGEDIDIDVNIWIHSANEVRELLEPLERILQENLILQGPDKYAYDSAKISYDIAGRQREVHLKFRSIKDSERPSLAEKRHGLLTDESYQIYMNLKYQLKKRGGPDYEDFKKLEMAALKE